MVGFRKPNNAIVVAGNPIVQELEVRTATNCVPGRLVERDTTDSQVKVGTATGNVIGWLGYEQASKQYRPASISTAYAANAQAPVLSGGGFVMLGRLASGQNVSKGVRLVAAANGEVTAASALAVPSGATTVTSNAAQPNISGAYGSQGVVVAIAEESVDASAEAKDIMVRSQI